MKTILQSTLLIALSALLGCQSLRAQTVNKLDVFGYNQQEGRVSTQIDSDGNRYVLATLQHTVGSFSGFQTIDKTPISLWIRFSTIIQEEIISSFIACE